MCLYRGITNWVYPIINRLIGAKRKIYVTSLQNGRIYQNRYIIHEIIIIIVLITRH